MTKCIYYGPNGECLRDGDEVVEYCVEGPCSEEITKLVVEEVIEKDGGLIVKVRKE